MFKENDGPTSCADAYISYNEALNGGVIYATEEAVIDWKCDMTNNSALSGSAM